MVSTKDNTPAARQYTRGTFATMAVYVLAIFAASFAVRSGQVNGAAMIGLALLPGLAIVGQIVVTLNYLRQADEDLKAVLARRLIIACMATLAIFTGWGFLETFAGFSGPAGWAAYCIMWGLFGLIACVERFRS